jgi:hypothetical protein
MKFVVCMESGVTICHYKVKNIMMEDLWYLLLYYYGNSKQTKNKKLSVEIINTEPQK